MPPQITIRVGARGFGKSRQQYPTLTKQDILALVEPVSDSLFKFDEATYKLQDWKAIWEAGHLNRLLSKARVVEGKRNANVTTYLFITVDNELIITPNKYWKEKKTRFSADGSRHEMLALRAYYLKNGLPNT